MTDAFSLALLGKPQVTRGGAPVEFVYNKALALLAYLSVHARTHSRGALAALLWSDMPEDDARANLRKVLVDLRHCLGNQLEITRQSVAFDPELPRWVDIEVFQARLRSLKSTTLEPASLTEYEVEMLAEAAALYRGDFLEGFSVRDAPLFEEWVLPQRERLRQMALYALHTLTSYYIARGLYVQGIESATRLMTLEPWHEEVHRQMMLLLALSGQRSAALDQYEACCHMLATELGVKPTHDTVALYRRIAAGEIGRAPGTTAYPVPPDPIRPPTNLPEHLTPFTGRTAELRLLVERLTSPAHRLVTITGVSGAGKTRLALQAAGAAMAHFSDGVFYVPVGQVDCTAALVPALAEALTSAAPPAPGGSGARPAHAAGVPYPPSVVFGADQSKLTTGAGDSPAVGAGASNQPGTATGAVRHDSDLAEPVAGSEGEQAAVAPVEPCTGDALAGLLDHLRGRQILLILDGFEQLSDAGALISELLRRLPGLKLLLTSAVRLNVTAEAVLPLGGLPWEPAASSDAGASRQDSGRDGLGGETALSAPSAGGPAPWGRPSQGDGPLPPAVQLFDRAAQRARLDFTISAEELPHVVHICQMVGGLPLGIEIAAAWVGVLTCAAIAGEMELSLDFLTARARDGVAHHLSLRAALDQSWKRLSEEEQRALRRLSVLPPGFTREAAAAVAGASLSVLATLADRGLLRRTPFGRYELHQFTAKYASELLARFPDEQAETERRCQSYMLQAAIAPPA